MKIANTLIHAASATLALMLSLPSTLMAFDNYKQFKRDRWDFDLSSEYFRTESNYNSGGSQERLGSGQYLHSMDVNIGTRYFLGKKSSFFASTTISTVETRGSIATRTNSTISQAVAGVDWLAYSESFDLIPEVSLLMPLDVASLGGDTALNAEGVVELRPRFTVQTQFRSFGTYAYSGFTYRDKGRSFLLPWGVGAFYKLSNSRVGAEIFGYQSITDDKDTKNRSERLANLMTVNAGSLRYASVNPSLMDTNFFWHTGINNAWSFDVAGGISVMGTNTASGFHLGALVRYSWDLTRGYSEPTPTYEPSESTLAPVRGRSRMYQDNDDLSTEGKVKRFKETTNDGVDQKIFKKKALTPAPVRPDRDPRLQKQLDDVEMQIELKSNKKKKKRR